MASRCLSTSPSQSSTADHLSLSESTLDTGWNARSRPVRDALFHCLFARRVANIYNLGDTNYSNTGRGREVPLNGRLRCYCFSLSALRLNLPAVDDVDDLKK